MNPRAHHYLFAHRELREILFQDLSAFVKLTESSLFGSWLSRLWTKVGDDVYAGGLGAKLPGTALAFESIADGGARYTLITLPTPEAVVEVFFIAIVVCEQPYKYYRYLVLEKCEEGRVGIGPSAGVLCEWFSDGGRRNHNWYLSPEKELFHSAIKEMHRRERVRFELGLNSTMKSLWNPKRENKPSKNATEEEEFRTPHIYYAMVAVPEALNALLNSEGSFPRGEPDLAKAREKLTANKAKQLDNLLAQQWKRAHEISFPNTSTSKSLHAELVDLTVGIFLLISFPEPIEAPEPFFMLCPLDKAFGKKTNNVIYLAELPRGRSNFEVIISRLEADKGYAILGSLEDCTKDTFIQGMKGFFQGQEFDQPAGILDHLQTIARTFGVLKSLQPKKQK
ncbi:hypothetical protein SAMN04488109_0970 [Chryseolinea serpens]|uniref:Uncharacterized protein n=1 Tax=Chryseolinea serpens TaxID=947013 RepID=A0A1M5L2C4_9BACT|nr:hypothetical protein [Chryseolinea serpens]SHG59080.1 hypothetical protein SAMN04488109_0970 [Chryseolinea serpens]